MGLRTFLGLKRTAPAKQPVAENVTLAAPEKPSARILSKKEFARTESGDKFLFPVEFATDGLGVNNRNLSFLDDPRFVAMWTHVSEANAPYWKRGMPQVQWRILTLVTAAQQATLADGIFVDCGVYTGSFALAVCRYLDFEKLDRSYFLFDTFTGIPTDSIEGDELLAAERMNQSHYAADVYEVAKRNFAAYPNVHLVPGRLPDTLGAIEGHRIAYMSVDLNSATYEMQVIERLWPQMSPGGVIVLDDYGFKKRSQQYEAWNRFAASVGHPIFLLPTGQGMMVRGR